MDNPHSQGTRRSPGLLFVAGSLAIVLALTVLIALLWRQDILLSHDRKTLKEGLQQGRKVRVVPAAKAAELRPVVLMGEARPFLSVTLYAKISGYLQEIRVDKGDKVEEGQLIAKIESPELTRQYAAAAADAKNKRTDAERAQYLLKSGAVSEQNAETADTTARVAEENAAALLAQKDYEMIWAPFAGTVTARFADPGALIQSATGSQTASLPVVTISQTDLLRVYVYPDQKTASSVRVGDRVEISDATRPEVKIAANVSRTSGELDIKTRTLLVEIDVDNSRGEILPGSFVQVTLFVRAFAGVEIPAESLLMRGDKAFVGVVTKENKVDLREVKVDDSDGRRVRLRSGVEAGEQVILSPGQSISTGESVQPVKAPAK